MLRFFKVSFVFFRLVIKPFALLIQDELPNFFPSVSLSICFCSTSGSYYNTAECLGIPMEVGKWPRNRDFSSFPQLFANRGGKKRVEKDLDGISAFFFLFFFLLCFLFFFFFFFFFVFLLAQIDFWAKKKRS